MTRYRTQGDQVHEAASPEELVSEMHEASFATCGSDAEFMVEMAQRAKLQTGATIRTDSAKIFVADLIAAGLLKEAEEGEDEQAPQKAAR